MSPRPLGDRLRDARSPDANGAERRARQVVLAAHAEQRPADGARPRKRLSAGHGRLAVLPIALSAGVLTAGAGAVAATGSGDHVRDWVRDLVGEAERPPAPAPALGPLPAPGRLLVTANSGAWIIRQDGTRRRLGPYTEATWSPGGLFVAAVRGRQLVATEPDGDVRWALTARARVHDPRWAPSGYRVAYRVAGTLRVVAGDGSGDQELGPAAPIASAWRPAGARNELTYVDRDGVLIRVDVDGGPGRVLLRRPVARLVGPVRGLAWSVTGMRLLLVGATSARILRPDGTTIRRIPTPAGTRIIAGALSPDGRQVALVTSAAGGRRSVVLSSATGTMRVLFSAVGGTRSVTWAPDGSRVLATWPGVDQWLVLGVRRGTRTTAYGNVAAQFDPGGSSAAVGPSVAGWCCALRGKVPSATSTPHPATTAAPLIVPRSGPRHQRFVVAFTGEHSTGRVGTTVYRYAASATAVRPAGGCVNNRERAFPDGRAGQRTRATLDPRRGEGGPEGWCPGTYRGTVTYTVAFACPAKGTCRPPADQPTRTTIVARFTFVVTRDTRP